MSRRGSDKNMGGVKKIGRKIRMDGARFRRRRKGTRKGMTELGKEAGGIIFRRKGKLGRKY
jgi:hypothetical protein